MTGQESAHSGESEPLAEIRRQVEQIEVYSRRQGWEPPPGALVYLPYSQARTLLDQVSPPGNSRAGEPS